MVLESSTDKPILKGDRPHTAMHESVNLTCICHKVPHKENDTSLFLLILEAPQCGLGRILEVQ